jgi:hypothetical protein
LIFIDFCGKKNAEFVGISAAFADAFFNDRRARIVRFLGFFELFHAFFFAIFGLFLPYFCTFYGVFEVILLFSIIRLVF